MAKMLSFDDVELYYDHVYALKGVSIELHEGETVALIGANGAGKSSVLRAITGLQKIRSGSITYMGERLDGTPPAQVVRKGIAMVPEGRRVFPLMSVKDNLLMGAFTRTDKAETQRTLESVLTRFPRLRERFHQQASTLSGGEQQMMVIGRALMDGLVPLHGHILCVSGRLSFELVQKAAVAGAPILVGVGAPTSLAVDLAACDAWKSGPDAAAKIVCPTLFLSGESDVMTPARKAAELAKLVRGAKSVTLARAGHMMMSEQPDATLDALIAHLGAA